MKIIGLVGSRKFWVALVALVVILIQGLVVPSFKIDEAVLVDGVVILAAYVVSLAIDPGGMGGKVAGLVTSRRFWLAVFSVGFLVAQVFMPDFQVDQEILTGYVIVISTMLVGLAIDPGDPAGKWASLLRSRKFYAAVVGVVILGLNAFGMALPFGLTEEQLIAACVTIGGYIAGVALEGKQITLFQGLK